MYKTTFWWCWESKLRSKTSAALVINRYCTKIWNFRAKNYNFGPNIWFFRHCANLKFSAFFQIWRQKLEIWEKYRSCTIGKSLRYSTEPLLVMRAWRVPSSQPPRRRNPDGKNGHGWRTLHHLTILKNTVIEFLLWWHHPIILGCEIC